MSKPVLRYPPWDALPSIYLERLTWRLRDRLPMWSIYTPSNRDYPGRWIARLEVALPEPRPSRVILTAASLAELRSKMPPHLFRMSRSWADSLALEEVWL